MTENRIRSRSVLIIALLILSPILLMVTPPAFAAGPTITLSVTSGTGQGVTTGVKVTGTGFPSQLQNCVTPNTASSTVGKSTCAGVALYAISTSKSLGVSGATQIPIYGQTLSGTLNSSSRAQSCPPAALYGSPTANAFSSETGACTALPDANGNFIAYFDVPNFPYDTYNFFAAYTPAAGAQQITPPVVFTIVPYIDVRLANDIGISATTNPAVKPTSRSVHWGNWVTIKLAGFYKGEAVTITGLPLPSGTTVTSTVDSNGCLGFATGNPTTKCLGSTGTGGSQSPQMVRLVGTGIGGPKTVTATGQTSGQTATRQITWVPAIAVYACASTSCSQSPSSTGISIPAVAPGTAYVELYGFANGETITSATVGGLSATLGSVTTNTDGTFGLGSGNHLALLYSQNIPYGTTTITLTGSVTGTVTFNAANGNILNPFASITSGTCSISGLSPCFVPTAGASLTQSGAAGTISMVPSYIAPAGGTPLLASTAQSGSSGTFVVSFNEASGFVGDLLYLYITAGATSAPPPTVTIASQITFTGFQGSATTGSSLGSTSTTGFANPACGGGTTTATLDTQGAAVCVIKVPASLHGSATISVATSSTSITNPGASWTANPEAFFSTYNSNSNGQDDGHGYVNFVNGCTAVKTSGLDTTTCASTASNSHPGMLGSTVGGNTGSSPASSGLVNTGFITTWGTGFGTATTTTATTETLTLTIGSSTVNSSYVSSSTLSTGSGSYASSTTASTSTGNNYAFSPSGVNTKGGIPDLAAGSYKITLSGSTAGDNATAYDYFSWIVLGLYVTSVVVTPSVGLSNTVVPTPLVNTNSAGDTIVVQSGTTTGIHGLKANTAYSLYLDGPSGTKLVSFNSTSNGQVPAGTQFTVPTASAGIHIIDIVTTSGASAITGQTSTVKSDTGGGPIDESTYGALLITIAGSLTLTPSAGPTGTVVAVTGSGFQAGTTFAIQIGGSTGEITYGTFVADINGNVPTTTKFTIPSMATDVTLTGTTVCTVSTTTACENGASVPINILNTATNAITLAVARFTLQAALTLGAKTASPGQVVSVSATGLVHNEAYNIIWGASTNVQGITQGTVVGSFTASSSDGSASGSFTVPASAASGSYTIQLLRAGGTVAADTLGASSGGVFKLVSPPVITVTQTTQNLGTNTFALSGSVSQTTLNGLPTLTAAFQNNLNTTLTGIAYAVVHNQAGQTVYYTTATISPAAGATATAYLALAGLPSGTYSVTVFVITPSGVAISQTSTASVSL